MSWSIVSLTVTGMPILNSALTRSAPRSAMRLASSWTVIASGTTTSRTCLACGPACWWALFSFSRARRSAASERARASPSSSSARVTVSLPRSRRCSSRPRVGRAGSGRLAGAWPCLARAWPAGARPPRRRPRERRGAPARRRGGPARPAPRRRAAWPLPRPLLGFFLGAPIVLGAAAFVVARRLGLLVLAAARFLERGQARFLGLAQQLLLALAAGGGVVGRARRGLGAGAGSGARATGAGGRDRLRLRRLGFARTAEDAALLDLDHDGVRAAMAEALLHLARLDRALQAQRRARSEFRLVSRLAHSNPSLKSSRRIRRIRRSRSIDCEAVRRPIRVRNGL